MSRGRYTIGIAIAALLVCVDSGTAQQGCTLPESITTTSGKGVKMASRESSLLREWIAIHDQDLPLDFATSPIVATRYANREYQLTTETVLQAREDITAIHVTYITFDVFGDRMTSLGATTVVDIAAGESKPFSWRWRSNANDSERFFASLAFVSRVRTKDGAVHSADYDRVLCVAEIFALAATEADLRPGSN